MRIIAVTASLGLAFIGLSAAAKGQAAMNRMHTNIPPEALAPALRSLAKELNFQVVYASKDVASLRTRGVVGEFTPEQALTKVLSGTGMTFRYIDQHTITVLPMAAAEAATAGTQQNISGPSSHNDAKEGKTSSSGGFRVAQANRGQTTRNAALTGQPKSTDAAQLEEVVVTAEKRNERLQDVPVPVTAVEGAALLDQNQTRLEDYFSSVPGLSVSPGDEHGVPQLAIRGITTGGFTTPTVGVVIDDVPFGGAGINYGFEAPDLDPSDIARVEVLRGPQGTLYGDSSMGGLIKYVTVAPSIDRLSGRIEAGLDTVRNGDQPGYNVRGSINVPLSDSAALRASGFEKLDPGYVDNIVSAQRDVNRGVAYGGRLSLLLEPSSILSLRLTALYQHARVDGSPDVTMEAGIGDLQQSDIPETGWRENEIQAYSVNVTANLGSIHVVSVTGYNVNSDADNYDFMSPFYTSEAQASFGVAGTPLPETVRTNQLTQELRLTGSLGSHFDWLLGGFYDHVQSRLIETVLAANPTTGIIAGNLGSFYQSQPPSVYHESAGFLDLTWKITDRLDVQVGARESANHFTPTPTIVTGILGNAFCGALPCIFPGGSDSNDHAFTYLFTPRLTISRDVMVYARLASGYRPGGSNSPPTPLLTYAPDTTRNYEVGLKADGLNHRISIDASLYYIDWRNIQIQLRDPLTNGVYTGNGGQAKSEGVEFSLQTRPLKGLTVSGWVTYDNAVITEISGNSSAAISVGDRLPNSSRWSGYAAFQQNFAITDLMSGFVGADESYVGNRLSVFEDTPVRQAFPSYAKTDFHLGVVRESWKVNLFVNNLTDRRGILSGGLGSLNPVAFYLIQPRTIGLSVVRTF